MKSITLYEDKNSILNKLSPEVKMLYVAAAIIISAVSGTKLVSIGFILFSILLLSTSKVIKKTLPILMMSGFVICTVTLMQGMFRAGNVTPVFNIGPAVFYKEGLLFAFNIAVNIINILLSFCVLVLTTKPSDIIENFIRKGFSSRIGYVFVSIFEIVPQMVDTMSTIMDAQKSRGMETEGNLLVRMRAFVPLISPVVMSSLVNTKDRAMALEIRGFNARNKKTFLNEEKKSKADGIIKIVLLSSIVIAVGWRVSLWLK